MSAACDGLLKLELSIHCGDNLLHKRKNLQRKGDVKIGYQSFVYVTSMHTELKLSTPSVVGVVNRQLQLEAVLTDFSIIYLLASC